MNFIRFFIIKDKFEVIKTIKYSIILKSFEHYLDLISYFYNSFHYYAQLI